MAEKNKCKKITAEELVKYLGKKIRVIISHGMPRLGGDCFLGVTSSGFWFDDTYVRCQVWDTDLIEIDEEVFEIDCTGFDFHKFCKELLARELNCPVEQVFEKLPAFFANWFVESSSDDQSRGKAIDKHLINSLIFNNGLSENDFQSKGGL
jgi:hypothetical protein